MKKSSKFSASYIISGLIALVASTPTTSPARDLPYGDSLKLTNQLAFQESPDSTIAYTEISPYAIDAYRQNKDVLYIMNTGDTICRMGGTLAWRNNNPGNLKYGDFARQNGAIGQGPKNFAVFPDESTGYAALCALLRSDKYSKLTIARAIAKYAPPHENNTAAYCRNLKKATGLNLNTQICNLDSAQMQKVTDVICEIEGWREGRILQKRQRGL